MKKIFACLCCLALLLPVMCSCQLVYITEKEEKSELTTALAVETRDISVPADSSAQLNGKKYSELTTGYADAEVAVKDLYAQDFTGYSFICVAAEEGDCTLSCDESDGMYYSYEKRNSLVTDYYKNSFYIRRSSLSDIKKDLAASVKAGNTASAYYSDILEVPALGAGSLAVSGLLMNLRALPFYTADTDNFSMYGTKMYFEDSRACENVSSYYCLFFNRTLCGDAISLELYRAALDGSFTTEVFLKAVKECNAEVNVLALTSDISALGEMVFIRSGLKYTELSDKIPVLSGTVKHASELDSVISALLKLNIYTKKAVTATSSSVPVASSSVAVASSSVISSAIDVSVSIAPSSLELFASGKALFYVGTLDDIEKLAEEKVMWGLLPLPSDSAEALNVSSNRSVFCVCANNARLEMTGLMLTALDAVSTEWIGDEFLINATQNHLRDNNSYYTLSKILEKRSFVDFAWIYGDSVKNLSAATYGALSSASEGSCTVSSSAIPLEKSVNTAISKLK